MKRRVLICLSTALALTACGTLRDDVAATVDGRDISVAEVELLAKSAALSGAAAPESDTSATVDANPRRAALALLVQSELYRSELSRRGGRVTAVDREAAASQVGQMEAQSPFDAATKPIVLRTFANQAALLRVAVKSPTIDNFAVAAYFAENRDAFGDLACLEGAAASPESIGAVRRSIEAGSTFDDVVTTSSSSVFPLGTDGPSLCTLVAGVSDPGLAELVGTASPGELVEYSTAAQDGSPITLLLRVTSRQAPDGSEKLVQDAARQQLQQQVDGRRQEQWAALQGPLFAAASVEVDPRYGRFDPASQTLIVAPPVPASKVPAAKAPAGKAPGGFPS